MCSIINCVEGGEVEIGTENYPRVCEILTRCEKSDFISKKVLLEVYVCKLVKNAGFEYM